MESEMPEQIPSGPEDDSVFQSNKRRRNVGRPTRTITQRSESSNAPSTERQTLMRSSPQRGSSREMTPPEGAIKYTRTGRVSKASKGQRVHHCDECGKTYTRAEHLRRHQQNHKPGAFPCDVPGCGRSFYREDLLTRHKVRHDDPESPSREASPESQSSEPTEHSVPIPGSSRKGRVFTVAGPDPPQVALSQAPSGSITRKTSTRTDKGYLDINQLQRTGHASVTLATGGTYPGLPIGGFQLEPSPPYSPAGYDSPTTSGFYLSDGQPYFQPQWERTRQSSNSSYLGYYPPPHTSRSPVSAGSSTIHLPHWANSANNTAFQNFSSSSDSEGPFGNAFGVYSGSMTDQHLLLDTFGSSRVLTPEDRDFMEQDDLLIPARPSRRPSVDLSLDENTYTNEERYLGAYWLWIHPLFPVVHRPFFTLQTSVSPLLKAAMLALGAHALGDSEDKRNARVVHERCAKVMKKRTLNNWHSFRTCDMQAIVLIEVYSIFKARRPPLQVSKIFEEVFQTLANDISVLNGDLSNDEILLTGGSGYLDEFSLSVETRCKQRLLSACYILDHQHATLFGRQRATHFPGSGMELPFPKSQSSWDANNELRRSEEPTTSQLWEALDGRNLGGSGQQTNDVFQSMLMMASLGDNTGMDSPQYASNSTTEFTPLLSTMEQSPRMKLAYHTFMLCKHTPIRELLAVAGESWVMAEKLTNSADYTASQIESSQWATGCADSAINFTMEIERTPVKKAVRHAFKILELHLNHPKTGLLFQEWAVYLACVVVWARAYVTSSRAQLAPRLAIPTSVQPRLSPHELDKSVSAVIAAGAHSEMNIDQAMKILRWAKARIENVDIPHNCGLTNGALDVLGKLVSRGCEEGWFGS